MARVSSRSNEAHWLMELVPSVSWDSYDGQAGLSIVDLVTGAFLLHPPLEGKQEAVPRVFGIDIG